MRPAAAAVLLLLALPLAGCTSPFTPYPSSNLPELRAVMEVKPYDSDANGRTDGIAITLRSAQPPPPLVGSDVIFNRNGDTNVTVWRCPQRVTELCPGNRGLLSWDVGETIYIRALPGVNRLDLRVRERFEYNTTVRADETRDTEVWAALDVRPYDSNGNQTTDGLQISLIDSDKVPFSMDTIRVLINKIDAPLFSDSQRLVPAKGFLNRGQRLFVDGVAGDNRIEVFIGATRYLLGTYQIGE